MAKIKKIQEGGETIYPATITNAIKDVESGETLAEILENKANVDGTYPEMEVGAAYDVVNDGSFTSEEISFRPSGGTNRNVKVNGVARIEKIKGNSVVHNQLLANDAKFGYENENAMGFWFVRQGAGNYSLSNNGITLYFNSGTSSVPSIGQNVGFKKSHKYLISMDVIFNGQFDEWGRSIYMGFGINSLDTNAQSLENFLVPYRNLTQFSLQFIVEANVDAPYFVISVRKYTNDVGESLTINNAMIIDLTREFTAGNEPTKEEFWQKVVVGKNLNERNTGEIIDGNYGGIKTVGFNAFNGTYAKVCGGVPYYLGGNYTSLGFTTEEGEITEAITIPTSTESVGTTPSDRLYTPLQNGYIYAEGENININISWDTEYGYLNGTYQPYKPSTHDLSWISKYFPNGMRSAGSVRDEIRFNSETQKWEAVQNVGVVDLGTLSWALNSTTFLTSSLKGKAKGATKYNVVSNILTAKYEASTWNDIIDGAKLYGIGMYPTGEIRIYDTRYSTASEFKSAMQGVMLNYELATPIVTEITEDINMDFDVSDYGTEELIAQEGKASAIFMADISYLNNTLSSIKQIPTLIEKTDKAEEDIKNIKKEIDVIQEKNIENDELEFYKAPNIEFIRPVAKDYNGYIGEEPKSIEEYIAGDYQIKISHPYYEKHKDECLLVIMKYGTLKRNINVPTLAKNSTAYFKPRTKWNFFKGGLSGNDSILTINNTIDENGFVTIRNFVDKILSRGVLKWRNEEYFIVAINYGDAEDALGVEVKSYTDFYDSPSQNDFITNDNMSDIFLSKNQNEQKFGIAVIKTNPEFIDADKPMDINEQHNICWSNGKYRWLISDITPFYMHVNLPMTVNNTVNQHFISISK